MAKTSAQAEMPTSPECVNPGYYSLPFLGKYYEIKFDTLVTPLPTSVPRNGKFDVWSTTDKERGFVLGFYYRANTRNMELEVLLDERELIACRPTDMAAMNQIAPNCVFPYMTMQSPPLGVEDVSCFYSPSPPRPYHKRILVTARNPSLLNNGGIIDGQIVRLVFS